jgi:hypothetical protein
VRFKRLPDEPASSSHLLAAGVSLQTDAVTAAVVSALRGAGIESILLRGPAIARWLYDDESARPYVDTDLLVRYGDVEVAERTLAGLGFSDHTVEGVLAHDRPTHAHTWLRARDAAAVDLHYTLVGARREPQHLWEALATETEPIVVLGTPVDVLKPPGRALVVALHAAQHGVGAGKPLDDLARAVQRVPEQIWEAAGRLAARLDATPAFATGLRLLPQGCEVASRLELPVDRSTETILRASSPPPMALGFDWLAAMPGLGAKARLVATKIVPDAAFMRAWSPLARRGRAGLVAAYGWRLVWLVWHAGPGLRAWRRARKAPHSSARPPAP